MIVMASKGHLEGTAQANRTKRLAQHILFDAYTTPDAKVLRDKCDLVARLHFDTEFAYVKVTRSTWAHNDGMRTNPF